jgi:hypothetical protein
MTRSKLTQTAAVVFGIAFLAGAGIYVAIGQTQSPKTTAQAQSTDAGRIDDTPVRKFKKHEGRLVTAYPELLPYMSEWDKEIDPKFLGDKPTSTDIPDSDIRQLYLEQIRRLEEVLRLDAEVLKIGIWDVPFLNQHLMTMECLYQAVRRAYPSPTDQLYWLRRCLVLSMKVEGVVHSRVYTARNLREQEYHRISAERLRFEAALFDTELAVKKAAGGR